MAKSKSGRETFVIQVLNQQNHSWQGLVTWTKGGKTQPFRSALELIKLIDSALIEREGEIASYKTKLLHRKYTAMNKG